MPLLGRTIEVSSDVVADGLDVCGEVSVDDFIVLSKDDGTTGVLGDDGVGRDVDETLTVGVVMPSSVVEGSKIEVGPVVEGLNGIVYVDVVTVLNKDDGTTGVLVEDGLP